MKPEVAKNYPHGTFLIINKADVIEVQQTDYDE